MCIRDSTVLDVDEDAGCDLLADCDGDGVGDETDAFDTDPDADADFDGDGLADSLNPNLPDEDVLDSCTISVSGTDDDSNGNGYDDAECSFTVPAGVSLNLVLQTQSWGSEALVTIVHNGTSSSLSGFSSGTLYDLSSYTSGEGDYTIYYEDTWGDGCNSPPNCYLEASWAIGTQNAQSTPAGTVLDNDDDDDGYLDTGEGSACDGTGDAYNASDVPTDNDGDFVCDALDEDDDDDGLSLIHI